MSDTIYTAIHEKLFFDDNIFPYNPNYDNYSWGISQIYY